MAERVFIEELSKHVGEEVMLAGWLNNRRSSGKIHFLQLRDGTGICQCVATLSDLGAEAFASADHLSQETSLQVTGTVREDKRAPGGYELTAKSFEVVSPSNDYPITPKEHGVAFLHDLRHLWIRSSKQNAILRVRSEVEQACRDFFYERGFVLFDAPVFTPTSCEGTTNLFEVDYFGERKAYLTQSGQLYAEAGALALGKVYCFGPTFRAEKSKTRRHLTEFWMVEPE
ncbi:MAG TPA: amino acid--tRNA ligase-related protein, partial [Candidatus Binataceae bacterium]|nr:amino acid--tRNA ligase-related protein [Candidatus Binataceae bacterium]